ncbi:DHHW family protein [Niallia sp. XMNu-256]|uniref:DHHW family protein n=1 Tax=Niallia sp. XMNu-256 TaxID=3082444 RepID=UPI0030D212A0
MNSIKLQTLLISIFFLVTIIGFFIYYFISPDKDQSVLENRQLVKRPDFTLESFATGEYSKRFETYYNDQFPIRESFVESNALIERNVFRQDVYDDVYIADDGYLLSKVERGTLESAKGVAKSINNFAEDMGKLNVTVYTAIMPNKSTMMQDKFPTYFQSYGQENMDLLFKELSKVANPIDSRDYLEKHMDEDHMFYYTDHHWQAKAAFYAYQNVMSYIFDKEDMNEQVYTYQDYNWELKGKPFIGSDARKTTSVNAEISDQIMVATLKEQTEPFVMKWGTKMRKGLYEYSFLDMEDPYTNRYQAYLGGDYANLSIHNDENENRDNILVIKDSYANAFVQFLAPHYRETHVIDLRHYKGKAIREYVKEHDIKHILLLNNVNSIYVTPALTSFNNPGQGENQ